MRDFARREQTTDGKYPMNYILDTVSSSDWLIVTFSSFVPRNASIKKPYQFINILQSFHCNKLFIQDSIGSRGVYYLCSHMDFTVSDEVCDLIRRVAQQLSIPKERVIMLGSSKGGSSALHIGLRFHCGYIIAIVPQTKIGSYVLQNAKDTWTDMIDADRPEESAEALNRVVFDALSKNEDTMIYLMTSEGDEQYPQHILPLLEALRIRGNGLFEVTYQNGARNHQEVAVHNPPFVKTILNEILYGLTVQKTETALMISPPHAPYRLWANISKKSHRGGVERIEISEACRLDFSNIVAAELGISYDEQLPQDWWIIYDWMDNLLIPFFYRKGSRLFISLKPTKPLMESVEFSLYLNKNGAIIRRFPYQKSARFSVEIEDDMSLYNCAFFCRSARQHALIGNQPLKRIEPLPDGAEKAWDEALILEGFYFQVEIENRALSCVCVNIPQMTEGTEFAFYVKRDGQIIYRTRYSQTDFMRYQMEEPGAYSVVAFLRQNGKIVYRESKAVSVHISETERRNKLIAPMEEHHARLLDNKSCG